MSFAKTVLGDVCTFQEGYVNPSQKVSEYFDGPIKWLRANDLNNAYVFDTSRTLSEKGFESAGKSAVLFEPDTLAISKSGTIGRLGILKDKMCGNRAVINIKPDPNLADPLFVFYALLSDQHQISTLADGSVQKNLYVSALSGFEYHAPSLAEQTRISEALSSLDDKIELNRRMNETLEEMARALFRDWFVDFGPTRRQMDGVTDPAAIMGHAFPPEKAATLAPLFPARLGDDGLPEGWGKASLNGLGKVVTGKTPSTKNKDYYGPDIPFLKIPDMHGKTYVLHTGTMLTTLGASTQAKKTVPAGSVSVSCIATPGLVVLNHRDTQTNQQINTVVPNSPSHQYFTFWSCREIASEVMTGGSGGSVFHNMNKTTFESLEIVFAGDREASLFGETVKPLHDKILANEEENHTLAEMRDLLLPKLMSGEIRLKDAERCA